MVFFGSDGACSISLSTELHSRNQVLISSFFGNLKFPSPHLSVLTNNSNKLAIWLNKTTFDESEYFTI